MRAAVLAGCHGQKSGASVIFSTMRRLNFFPVLALLTCMLVLHPRDLWAAEPAVDQVRVTLRGLSDAPRANALRAIALRALRRDPDATPAQIERLHRRAPAQIRAALEPFGYYHASVDARLSRVGARYEAIYTVDPGEPVRVGAMEVRIEGAAAGDGMLQQLVEGRTLREGSVLVHADYEDFKAAVQRVFAERGYLEAETVVARVEVRLADNRADVRLHWNSGPRYRLTEARFVGNHVPAETLAGFVPWRGEVPYTQQRLIELQTRLGDTGWFSTVEVSPLLEELAEGRVPVEVRLTPSLRTAWNGGVSVGTDSGFGVRGAMERRWVNERGDKLKLEANLSQRQSGLAAAYEIAIPGEQRRAWGMLAGWRDEQTTSSESQLSSLALYLRGDLAGWAARASVNFLSGDFDVGGERGNSTLLYPELTLSRRDADDYTAPRRGWSLAGTVRVSPGGAGSSRFASVELSGAWIRGFGERWRVLTRGAIGLTETSDFNDLPPQLRFFAGGDRSLRGYAWQALGSRNAAGNVIGGDRLLTLSAELERRLTPTLGVAGFVDVGNAFLGSDVEVAKAVGLGLRWRSPVGTVRVDAAHALDDPGGVRFHLIIGPDL
jgi:translocation and assembly module TamA